MVVYVAVKRRRREARAAWREKRRRCDHGGWQQLLWTLIGKHQADKSLLSGWLEYTI